MSCALLPPSGETQEVKECVDTPSCGVMVGSWIYDELISINGNKYK